MRGIISALLFLILIHVFLPSKIFAADIFTQLPCTPTPSNGRFIIRGGVAPLEFTMGSVEMWRGAISSFKINNLETVDVHDSGRLLQYAFQVNGGGENNNPTEGVGSSVVLGACSTTNQVYTKTRMGYWRRYNNTLLSDFILEKFVQIGALGRQNIISFSARYTIPSPVTGMHFEIPTGYHIGSYSQMKLYDIFTKTIRDPTSSEIILQLYNVFPKGYLGPHIPVVWNGTYAIAAYSPSTSQNMWGSDLQSYSKWSLGQWVGAIDTQYFYSQSYMIVTNSLAAMASDLNYVITSTTPNPEPYTPTLNIWGQNVHGRPTITGPSYTFDGVDDYIDITDYPFENLPTFSYEVIFSPQLTPGQTYILVSKDNTARAVISGDGSGHCIVATTNTPWYGTGAAATWPVGKVLSGMLNQIACVYDGTKTNAYVNGRLVSTSGLVTGLVKDFITSQFSIGKKSATTNNWYKGSIRQVTLWKSVVPASEIATRYTTFGGSTPTPTSAITTIPSPQVSSPTPSQSQAVSGDLNGDSHVDIFDYNILLRDFGKRGTPGFIPADINRDGSVDIFDYNIVTGNFGR